MLFICGEFNSRMSPLWLQVRYTGVPLRPERVGGSNNSLGTGATWEGKGGKQSLLCKKHHWAWVLGQVLFLFQPEASISCTLENVAGANTAWHSLTSWCGGCRNYHCSMPVQSPHSPTATFLVLFQAVSWPKQVFVCW